MLTREPSETRQGERALPAWALEIAPSPLPTPPLPRLLWEAWLAYAHRAGAYQTRALLNVLYFVLLGPSVLVARAAGTRLLDLGPANRSSYWLDREPLEATLDALERQF